MTTMIEEYLIAFVESLNDLFDDLKITDEEERSRLRLLVASSMGRNLGNMAIIKVKKEMEKQQKKK